MKKSILLFLILVSIADLSAQKYNLIWSDEFNYSGLPDTTKWINEVGFIRNKELQYYTKHRLDNSIVTGGNLLIIGKKESFKNAEYTSASINTLGKFSFKYGKAEARIKLPVGQGMWPAFWMMGDNRPSVGWPKCGEIDVMEHINKELKTYGTAHWDKNGHVQSGGTTYADASKWHLYGVEWNQDSIRWFLDGKRFWGVNIKNGENDTQEFHTPYYLLLNLAIGGSWPKNPDATTVFPDTMYVDYVRVYQLDIKK
jgi:beta-glucanase (GH16 family)